MPGRIERRFAALRAEGRAGLVTFITAGDPDAQTSEAILRALPAAGADLIELGMPFSDPMADGPAIQAASLRALRAGHTMARTLAMCAALRRVDAETPLILMGYYNPIYVYGVERFTADAKAAGVDGLIVVDLPPEENEELRRPAEAAGLDVILLIAPTTDDARLRTVVRHAGGFIYYVSITGVTGTAAPDVRRVASAVGRVHGATSLPVAVGFGIRSRTQAAEMAAAADAAVVGSALVDAIASAVKNGTAGPAEVVGAVTALVGELAAGIRSASRAGALE